MPDPKTPKLVCSAVVRLLREARKQKGLSMTVLAERAGLSLTMISFVERELRNPTLDTVVRIAEVLEADLGALIQQATREAKRTRGK